MIYFNNKKYDEVKLGGTEGSNYDFSQLGYDETQQTNAQNRMLDSLNYSKSIKDSWDANTTIMDNMFASVCVMDGSYIPKNIFYFPMIDTSKVTSMQYTFYFTSICYLPKIDTSKVTNFNNTFSITQLKEIPDLDTSSAIDMSYMFYQSPLEKIPNIITPNCENMDNMLCGTQLTEFPINWDFSKVTNLNSFMSDSKLKVLPKFSAPNCTDFSNIVAYCKQLEKIEELDLSNMTTNAYSICSYSPNLRYALIKGLGAQDGSTMTFSNTKWGQNDEKYPDALQSMKDSLIKYSVQVPEGHSFEIQLPAESLALLSEDEKAQIAAKNIKLSEAY